MDEKKGNIVLVKAPPEKFEIISSFQLPKGRDPCWSNPVINDGTMYVRRGSALLAYNISKLP
jgi:outer membrane protein assembly factor BamB